MKHLNIDRWFYKQPNGYLRMKRVSKVAEKHFPHEWRRVYQKAGGNPVALIKVLMKDYYMSLATAWHEVKYLFNEVPK